ncbi:MAG: undecaprenyl-diphosphatase UppP [Patescibacteria group bacterium]|uniref:Undecaprenyl-diphosphatase n=1 Tax=candidate division WWE3 bacterium TaxID=2053526 RepID=A0A955EAL0_UNCKA|nr:undecaprenyl-diphosphatase UppP [candidate division WWE3 bacterium]
MDIFQALVLGITQGLTEFLPISSTGHLILVSEFMHWPIQPLVFDAFLHLGTLLAVFAYFRKDVARIILHTIDDLIKNQRVFSQWHEYTKLGFYILLGTIPALLLGLMFGDTIEANFREVFYVLIFLALGTGVMYYADTFYSANNGALSFSKSLLVGFFQALALLPGFSRSGATISGGLFVGLSRENSARFAFLLSLPIIFGAGVFKLIASVSELSTISPVVLLVGFVSSFVVGLICIRALLLFLKTKSLMGFIIYRGVLAVVLLGYIIYTIL